MAIDEASTEPAPPGRRFSTAGSEAMHRRARLVTPGGVHGEGRTSKPYPLYFRRALGSRVWDVDDNEYIDFHSGFGAVLLGHNDPRVREAVADSMREHGVMMATANELEVQLSEKLVEHVPSAEMVLLSCTGSEVTYHAIRLARGVTGRRLLLKFEGNYHGWHDYVAWNTHFDPSMSRETDGLVEPIPASAGMTPGAVDSVIVTQYNDVDGLRTAFERHGPELAAVILEPIFHNLGVVLPEPGFLEACRSLCDEHGTILIFDEIITGFRQGLGGAQTLVGVLPDLSTFGKAMANGFPISALTGRREYMSQFVPDGKVLFSGTFTGQLVNVAAALATIAVLEGASSPYEQMTALTTRLATGVRSAIEETGLDAQVRSFGSVWAMYFIGKDIRCYRDLVGFVGTKEQATLRALQRHLLERGIYIHPHETLRGYVTAAHDEDDVDRTVRAITEFVHSWARGRH